MAKIFKLLFDKINFDIKGTVSFKAYAFSAGTLISLIAGDFLISSHWVGNFTMEHPEAMTSFILFLLVWAIWSTAYLIAQKINSKKTPLEKFVRKFPFSFYTYNFRWALKGKLIVPHCNVCYGNIKIQPDFSSNYDVFECVKCETKGPLLLEDKVPVSLYALEEKLIFNMQQFGYITSKDGYKIKI